MSKEPVEKHPLMPLPESIFCKLGWHTYEKEPGLQYYVREGFSFFFFTSGDQVGIKRCRRCEAQKYVCRSGIIGAGGSADKWQNCSEEKAEQINSRSAF